MPKKPDSSRRVALHKEILSRLEGVPVVSPEELAVSMMSAALSLLAKAHPGKPDAEGVALIKSSYPPATKALIAERALNVGAAYTYAGAAAMVGGMALDYVPQAHVGGFIKQDVALPEGTFARVERELEDLFARTEAAGVSPWGAAVLMLRTAVSTAVRRGVHPLQVIKAVFDMVRVVRERLPMANFEP